MRKVYRKPDIVFEDFTLSANIAGNCGEALGNHAETNCERYVTASNGNSCFYFDNNAIVFSETNTSCFLTPENDGDGNPDTFFGLCYQVPSDENRMFNS